MRKIVSILLAVVMIATLFVLSACNSEPTSFKTPEERYEYVVNKNVKSLSEPAIEQYSEAVKNVNSKKVSTQLGIELGKDLQSLIKTTASMDIDSLKSLAIKLDSTISDNALSLAGSVLINDTDVASIEYFIDAMTGKTVGKIPLLYDGYLLFTDGSEENEPLMAIEIPDFKELAKALPTAEEINELITKYVGIFLSKTKAVEVTDVDYTVGSLSEKAKSIKTSYSAKDLADIGKEILESVKIDETVKTIFNRIAEAVGTENTSEAYQAFVEQINSSIDSIKEIKEEEIEGNRIDVELFTNSKNEIIGAVISIVTKKDEIIVYDDDTVFYDEPDEPVVTIGASEDQFDTTIISMGCLESKDKYSFKFSVADEEKTKLTVTSEGTKVGDKVTGSVLFTTESGESIMRIKDLDVEALKNGSFSGEIAFPLDKALSDIIKAEDVPSELKKLAECELIISGKSSASETDMSITVKSADADFITITIKASVADAEAISVPSEATPVEEVFVSEEVLYGSLEKFTTNLQNAGLSDQLVMVFAGLLSNILTPQDY